MIVTTAVARCGMEFLADETKKFGDIVVTAGIKAGGRFLGLCRSGVILSYL